MEGFNTIKGFSTIEEVLDDLRQGKIVLVTPPPAFPRPNGA